MSRPWDRSLTRRTWLTRHALTVAALVTSPPTAAVRRPGLQRRSPVVPADQAERLDPAPWQALAQHAVDAARSAGARYADARLTRVVQHHYWAYGPGLFWDDSELLGVGIRALVNGYWGFAASTVLTPDAIGRLARDAVAQATENAKGTLRTVDLGTIPIARGTWATPIRIDPFAVPIEEKLDFIEYWNACASQAGDGVGLSLESRLSIVRQERIVATSEGALFTQTLYESGGTLPVEVDQKIVAQVHGIAVAAQGWELFLDAKIPEQLPERIKAEIAQALALMKSAKPSTVGRYTVVCDGATMAALVEATLGVATQLDRALGYEANATGTSFIDDPLAMVGHLQLASPLVTVTANRSTPTQLATVQWDDDGVVPPETTLIQDGVLTDFQTTREQAAWLAPYDQQHHRPVRSHGCAAAEDAHAIPMQHLPNLALKPSAATIRMEDLVADVKDGILMEGGSVTCDFQAQTGLLSGRLRQITNGRLGRALEGGTVLFNTQDLWHHILAVGGPPTQMVQSWTQYEQSASGRASRPKGQPPQSTSHSVRAAAATIANQALIDLRRKA